jgi:DNA transformation protein and related proteins
MSTQQSTVDYILDQASDAGGLEARKMFGEYALYCRGKVIALICDDTLFMKPTAAGRGLIVVVREGSPYPGAKPHLVIDESVIENSALLVTLIQATHDVLPAPKPKPAKKRKS